MAKNDDLERWWKGLSDKQKAEALSSEVSGELTDAVADSLDKAGLRKGRKDRRVPDDVGIFLKTRH
jgi:hypothetical protein